ncbi:MAG: beta-glucosidase BglX [bacterium]
MKMKKILLVGIIFLALLSTGVNAQDIPYKNKTNLKIDSLLQQMTLKEKIGQLTQYAWHRTMTGPGGKKIDLLKEIAEGKVGSILNLTGAENTYEIQKIAVEKTRSGIPLIFGLDVIHGYKTIFPIPLGEAASWDTDAVERSARIAAYEAAAAGIQWTFAPMVDIARDPRWGRIMEGAGEDPYLGACIAAARVKGFQGNDLTDPNTILACAKHYAAYGAAAAGRDYNTVDISLQTLHEIYLPPFKAAVDAGAGSVMTSFNELNGIPATGNDLLITNILKKQWNFNGFVVSDWNAIREMIAHGFAEDAYEAALYAIHAGVDMDMMGHVYSTELSNLIDNNMIQESLIDEAVKRILRIKSRLGLFRDPYKYCSKKRENELLLHPDHLKAARDMARKSIVLLKNENNILPLDKNIKSIAVIGPLADNKEYLMGSWSARGEGKDVVSIINGIKNKVSSHTKILYAIGCNINDEDKSLFKNAVKTAEQAEIIIAAVGESRDMSGEAASRAYLDLPGVQEELLRELNKTGKPVIVVLANGRPLVLTWMSKNIPAILEIWLPGTEAGNAVADILFGDYNPSGKLPVSFPYAVGQIPVYYNHKNTGRPEVQNTRYCSKYLDIPNKPLYPFGYGLSYTTFEYSDLKLNNYEISVNDTLHVSMIIKNTGNTAGEEVVQLYIRDVVASLTRPVKELKRFRKIRLDPGEIKKVSFTLSTEDLGFYDQNMKYIIEPGEFKLFAGTNSENTLETKFVLLSD